MVCIRQYLSLPSVLLPNTIVKWMLKVKSYRRLDIVLIYVAGLLIRWLGLWNLHQLADGSIPIQIWFISDGLKRERFKVFMWILMRTATGQCTTVQAPSRRDVRWRLLYRPLITEVPSVILIVEGPWKARLPWHARGMSFKRFKVLLQGTYWTMSHRHKSAILENFGVLA